MRSSLKTGFSFGLTSAVITTLGLMIGLRSGTHSKLTVIGGVLIIAIADSLSDALGIHISEEAKGHSTREVWESTFSTLITKFAFTLTFLVPLLMFNLSTAVVISIIWGFSLLSIFSFQIARDENIEPWKVISEHLIVALTVVILTYYAGNEIRLIFR